jgi:AcrR family transcriptional regulator
MSGRPDDAPARASGESSAAARLPEVMSRPGKRGRYHHGDLKAALIAIAIELIGERGVRDFSLAEASRRLGVAVSAPYAHFADRDQLLAAVAVHAYERFSAELLPEMDRFQAPADRLAAMARAYVRFAAAHRPLFELLSGAGLDKQRHPELEAAERPITNAFLACVRALSGGEAPPRTWPPPWKPPPTATPCCCLAGASARGARPLRLPPSEPPAPPSPWSKAAAY